MEYIEEYKKILKGTNYSIESREQTNVPEIKFIDLIDVFSRYEDKYHLTIQINERKKIVYMYEMLYVEAHGYITYKNENGNENISQLLKNIIIKTIELSKKNNMKKILISDDMVGVTQEFLVTSGFKYLYNEFFLKKGIRKINLKIIQMIIIKNVMNRYNRTSRLDDAKDEIMKILKDVKLIYKSNKELQDFKKEMKKLHYWDLIEREIIIYLEMNELDLPGEDNPLDMMYLNL